VIKGSYQHSRLVPLLVHCCIVVDDRMRLVVHHRKVVQDRSGRVGLQHLLVGRKGLDALHIYHPNQ
jgi:hypothetical protein